MQVNQRIPANPFIVVSDQNELCWCRKICLYKLTIVVTTLILISLSLFMFKNSLYFTIALLVVSIITLAYLVLNTHLAALTGFMLVIVYVGAMIVLIGYICAVSPNLVLEPDYSYLLASLLVVSSVFTLSKFSVCSFSTQSFTLVDFFYSAQGLFIFFTLVFMLFFTLLIVTSQYSTPQGPLRCF